MREERERGHDFFDDIFFLFHFYFFGATLLYVRTNVPEDDECHVTKEKKALSKAFLLCCSAKLFGRN
jgi:hypothetical protein